jgi:hypothetical protein
MLTEIITWRESPVKLQWFCTPSYSCLDAKPQLVKRLQRALQPHWIGKVGLGSTLLSLLSSKASHICPYHSCDSEDTKQIMWVGRKSGPTKCVGYTIAVCYGCHIYTAKPNRVIFLESSVYRCAVDPKSNANLRFESQMANIVFIQEVLVLRFCAETDCDCLPDRNSTSCCCSWLGERV